MKALFSALVLVRLAAFPAPVLAGASPDGAAKSAQMQYLRGMLLERRGAYAEALEAYERAMAEDPHSAYIRREAADLALEIGLNDKALAWAQSAAELEPKSAESYLLLGKLRWTLGDAASAEKEFERALKIDPHSAESIFSLGSLLGESAPDKARELLGRFLEQNPAEAAEAHFQLSKLDLRAGLLKEAQEHLNKAIALDPGSETIPARYALAQTYEVQQATDAALGEYLRILTLEPENAALADHIGEIYAVKGQAEEARTKFETAKALQPGDPVANGWLAQDAEKRGDFLKAAQYLRASVSLKDDPGLNLRLSYYLIQAGRLKEAVEVLERSIARWPNNDQISYFLALGYDDLNEGAKAIKLLRRVVELKPDYRDARFQLAVLLDKYDDIGGAEKEFRLLLARKPDDAPVLNYLGYSLAERGLKLAEAEALVRQAVNLEPGSGAYLDSLAWVHFKQGKSTEAVRELDGALRLIPDDETVWDHLGETYAASGEPSAAWRSWMRAAFLNPSDGKLQNKLARVEKSLPAEELGRQYLDYLASAQGGLRKLGGLCEIKGTVLGRSFSFSGILTFRAPEEFDIDLLGPVFTPMFRIRMNRQGFVMDPLRVAGLNPEALMESAAAAFSLVRDYLAGRPFEPGPARYERGWRSREIERPGWRISLAADGLLAGKIAREPSAEALSLEEFARVQGRELPRLFKVAGKGFSFSLRLDNVKAEFQSPGPGGAP